MIVHLIFKPILRPNHNAWFESAETAVPTFNTQINALIYDALIQDQLNLKSLAQQTLAYTYYCATNTIHLWIITQKSQLEEIIKTASTFHTMFNLLEHSSEQFGLQNLVLSVKLIDVQLEYSVYNKDAMILD